MKSKKKLNTIKEKIETENHQYRLLTDEELEQVSGGKEEVKGIYPPSEDGVVVISDEVPDDGK